MADHHDRCATLIDIVSRCTCERERNYDVATEIWDDGQPVRLLEKDDRLERYGLDGAVVPAGAEGVVVAHRGGWMGSRPVGVLVRWPRLDVARFYHPGQLQKL